MPVKKSALAIELAAEPQGHDPVRHRFKLAQGVGYGPFQGAEQRAYARK